MSNLDDVQNRLVYTQKEFEQLKADYYDLNLKQKELLNQRLNLENDNEGLLNSIEQIKIEKDQVQQIFENEEKKLLNEINQNHNQELISIRKQNEDNEIHLKQEIQSLQLRVDHYENTITQCEEFRIKLEENLQKITQQRDINRNDLKLTQEMLKHKENEYDQLILRCNQCEKHLQDCNERFIQYETTVNDLQSQIKQYELQIQELNKNGLATNQVSLTNIFYENNGRFSLGSCLFLQLVCLTLNI